MKKKSKHFFFKFAYINSREIVVVVVSEKMSFLFIRDKVLYWDVNPCANLTNMKLKLCSKKEKKVIVARIQ